MAPAFSKFVHYRLVEGYDDYVVSADGRVFSLKNGKIREMKQRRRGSGNYLSVALWKDGDEKGKFVHTLVGDAFLLKHGLPTWDHISRDRSDNDAANIRPAPYSGQANNRRMPKTNTSEVMGVRWEKEKNKWHAQIKHKGKTYDFRTADKDAAIAWYRAKANEYKGAFNPRH
jgi:hypothetical protein